MNDNLAILEWLKTITAGGANQSAYGQQLNLPPVTQQSNPNMNISLDREMNFGDWANAGGDIMQGIAGLGQTALGYQQYKLGKKSFNESKRQFDLNFGAQQKTTNAALADRQRARIAANPNADYLPLDQYMKQYGI